jgi:hypothetical protein
VLPKDQWSYKQQGCAKPEAPSKHYYCIEDVLTGHSVPGVVPPPPPPYVGRNCTDTLWLQCWTVLYKYAFSIVPSI